MTEQGLDVRKFGPGISLHKRPLMQSPLGNGLLHAFELRWFSVHRFFCFCFCRLFSPFAPLED